MLSVIGVVVIVFKKQRKSGKVDVKDLKRGTMNRIHFLFSVADNHPEAIKNLDKDVQRILKRIIDVCPSCMRLKTCQKGCDKIKGKVRDDRWK